MTDAPEKLPPGITWDAPNRYNHAPRPIKSINISEYYRQILTWGFGIGTTHHQVYELPGRDRSMHSLYIHWYNDCAYAVSISHRYAPDEEGTRYGTVFTPYFYYIGCEHTNVADGSKSRMCYEEGKCSKCGRKYFVDSSD